MRRPTRRRALPPIPKNADQALRQYLQAMQEITETGEGVRGDALDRKLTIRDLLDSGFAKLKGKFSGYIDGSMMEGGPSLVAPPNMHIPPRPEEVYVVAVFKAVIVSWKLPHLQYGNHALTEVWRSEGEASNFGDAVNIGSSAGSMYSDYTVVGGIKYRYWVRYVSTADVNGPLDSPDGNLIEALKSVTVIMEELSGKIDESLLTKALSERVDKVDKIEPLEILVGKNGTAIETERTERQNEFGTFAQEVRTVQAGFNGNLATVQQLSETTANEFGTFAQETITAQGEFDGKLISAQQKLTAQGNDIDGLSAQYTLQLDVDGYVSGFGTYNDGKTSDFAILADRFWVTGPNSEGMIKPFIIENGNTYIKSAIIAEGSIESGQIGSLSFGKITDSEGVPVINVAGKLKGDLIEAENLVVAEAARFSGDVYSIGVPYIPNVQGWIIKQDGFVEFNNAQIRGNVDLDTLTVNGELPTAGVVVVSDPYANDRALDTTKFSQTVTFDESESLANIPAGATFKYDKLATLTVEVVGRSAGEVSLRTHSTIWKASGSTIVSGNPALPFDAAGSSGVYLTDNTTKKSELGGISTYERIGTFYAWTSGGSQSPPTTRFFATATTTFKVWVDDALQVNESSARGIDFSLSPSWTGSYTSAGVVTHSNRVEKIEVNVPLSPGDVYTYPEFRASSTVRVLASIVVTNAYLSGPLPPPAGRQLKRRRNAAGISGNLSRL